MREESHVGIINPSRARSTKKSVILTSVPRSEVKLWNSSKNLSKCSTSKTCKENICKALLTLSSAPVCPWPMVVGTFNFNFKKHMLLMLSLWFRFLFDLSVLV